MSQLNTIQYCLPNEITKQDDSMFHILKKFSRPDHVNITQSKYFRDQLSNHDKHEEFGCFRQK